MVICVPGAPLAGETLEIVAVVTGKVTALDQAPAWCTRAVPEVALEATMATICVSLQLTTTPKVLPSHTVPVPCVVPNPEPEIVTWTPAAPDVGVRLVMVRGTMLYVARSDAAVRVPAAYAMALSVVVALMVIGPL
jgi:hypothetical protein